MRRLKVNMTICLICNEENPFNVEFCTNCGKNLEDNQKTTIRNGIGSIIFPDEAEYEIDQAQRLVGRADLSKYTKQDPTFISRSHFTIYKSNETYFIKDGVTNVQNKASEKNTFVNGEKLGDSEVELKNNDKIIVSDIEMSFVM